RTSMLQRHPSDRSAPATRDQASGTRTYRQAESEPRPTHSRRGKGAARITVRAVGPERALARECPLEALRRGAQTGAAGTDHQAEAQLRLKLIPVIPVFRVSARTRAAAASNARGPDRTAASGRGTARGTRDTCAATSRSAPST